MDEKTVKCITCGVEDVPESRWNIPCVKCRAKANREEVKKRAEEFGSIGARQPAAVFEDDNGNRIFVDKFGKPVKDHDYDLDNDPRGWRTTGKIKPTVTVL